MTDWADLVHAYGAADDVPELLAAAGASTTDRETWDALWGRLCHQGTVYSASYAALPALTALAEHRPAAGYVEPLHLAAAIVASNDGPDNFQTVEREYGVELRTLRSLAERNLPLARGFTEFVYAVQALMSFEGSAPWNRRLQVLADEELDLECPNCQEYLTIALAGPPWRTTTLDDAAPVTSVSPVDPNQLRGVAARIYGLGVQHGQAEMTGRLPYIFGTTACPVCDVTFHIPTALLG